MSSRNSPIPASLTEKPSSPFLPTLPSSASRRPIVRRPTANTPSARLTPAASRPFGEIGKEDDDSWDVMTVASASSWGGGGDVDETTAAFVPRWRDARLRRPVVRKKVVEARAGEEEAAEEKKAGAEETQDEESKAELAPAVLPEQSEATTPVTPAAPLSADSPAVDSLEGSPPAPNAKAPLSPSEPESTFTSTPLEPSSKAFSPAALRETSVAK